MVKKTQQRRKLGRRYAVETSAAKRAKAHGKLLIF